MNRQWLFSGEGQPLEPLTAGTLPVANAILPGAPLEHVDLLAGERSPVPQHLDRPSCYWYWLRPPLPRGLWELSMLPGDRLLVETTKDYAGRVDIVRTHLCTLRVFVQGEELFVLGSVYETGGDSRSKCELRAAVYDDRCPSDIPFGPAARQRLLKGTSHNAFLGLCRCFRRSL